MTAFHLAPHVGLQFWRNVPRLVAVDRADAACFAILSVATHGSDGPRISTRFDLPSQSDALAIVLAAVNAAYSLGHHDRMNRVCRAQGFEREAPAMLNGVAIIPSIERGQDDRD